MITDFWRDVKLEGGDLATFKTWPSVRAIPIYHDREYVREYAEDLGHMMPRGFTRLLKEPRIGHSGLSYHNATQEFFGEPCTLWTLKTAHHIFTFENMTWKDTEADYDRIIEFGAGIGETCRMIRDMGFEGEYIILDLPEVIKLSSFYLGDKARFITSHEDLPVDDKRTLFIGTWSFSEVPIEYRHQIMERVKGYDFLIVFQGEIFGIDNWSYFTGPFLKTFDKADVIFRKIPWLPICGGNYYLTVVQNV